MISIIKFIRSRHSAVFWKRPWLSIKNETACAFIPPTLFTEWEFGAVNPKAVDRIGRILERDKSRLFSFIWLRFYSDEQIRQIDNAHFRLMNRLLPGPYTFILPATNFVPKKVTPKVKPWSAHSGQWHALSW